MKCHVASLVYSVVVAVTAMGLFTTQPAIGQEVDLSGEWQNNMGKIVFEQRGQYVEGKQFGRTIIRGNMGPSGFEGKLLVVFSEGTPKQIALFSRVCGNNKWTPIRFLLTADGNTIRGTYDYLYFQTDGRNCWQKPRGQRPYTATRISPPPRSDTATCTQCSNALVATLTSKLNYVELEQLRSWLNETRVKYGACVRKIRDGCHSTKEYWMDEYALKGCYETGYVGEPLKQCILRAISE